jgi:hypothetical protein
MKDGGTEMICRFCLSRDLYAQIARDFQLSPLHLLMAYSNEAAFHNSIDPSTEAKWENCRKAISSNGDLEN